LPNVISILHHYYIFNFMPDYIASSAWPGDESRHQARSWLYTIGQSACGTHTQSDGSLVITSKVRGSAEIQAGKGDKILSESLACA
jgi:hypothetical protein